MSKIRFGSALSIGEVSSSRARRISRRAFGQRAATVAALSFSPVKLLAAPQGSRKESPAAQERTLTLKEGLAPEAAQEADAKLTNISRKYGTRLSGPQREHLRRILLYNEKLLAGVRAISLQNGDPPASVLKISLPGDQRGPLKRSASRR